MTGQVAASGAADLSCWEICRGEVSADGACLPFIGSQNDTSAKKTLRERSLAWAAGDSMKTMRDFVRELSSLSKRPVLPSSLFVTVTVKEEDLRRLRAALQAAPAAYLVASRAPAPRAPPGRAPGAAADGVCYK